MYDRNEQEEDSLQVKAAALGRLIEAEREPARMRMRIRLAPQTVEDVYQEACLTALQHLGQQRGAGGLREWFHRILTNAVAAEQRRLNRQPAGDCLGHQVHELEAHAPSSDCECATQLLGRAPAEDGRLLREVLVQGRSAAEYGSRNHIRSGAVRVRLFRARQRLRARLRQRCRGCLAGLGHVGCDCTGARDGAGGGALQGKS